MRTAAQILTVIFIGTLALLIWVATQPVQHVYPAGSVPVFPVYSPGLTVPPRGPAPVTGHLEHRWTLNCFTGPERVPVCTVTPYDVYVEDLYG